MPDSFKNDDIVSKEDLEVQGEIADRENIKYEHCGYFPGGGGGTFPGTIHFPGGTGPTFPNPGGGFPGGTGPWDPTLPDGIDALFGQNREGGYSSIIITKITSS